MSIICNNGYNYNDNEQESDDDFITRVENVLGTYDKPYTTIMDRNTSDYFNSCGRVTQAE